MDFELGRKLPFRSVTHWLPGPAVTITSSQRVACSQGCTVDSVEMHKNCNLLQQSPACTLDYASEGSELSVSDASEVIQEVGTESKNVDAV